MRLFMYSVCGGMYHMYIYSASMSKSSGSSVGNNIRLKLKRPVFESQLDQKFYYTVLHVRNVFIHTGVLPVELKASPKSVQKWWTSSDRRAVGCS